MYIFSSVSSVVHKLVGVCKIAHPPRNRICLVSPFGIELSSYTHPLERFMQNFMSTKMYLLKSRTLKRIDIVKIMHDYK